MKQLFLSVVLLICVNAFSQSANLDREKFSVSYVKLPTDPILENDKRTYSINVNGVKIQGFTKVNAPGNLDINYKFLNTVVSDVKIEKEKHEKKDKDGNVTSTWYTYKAKANFKSDASINVINAIINDSFEENYQESSSYSSDDFDSYYKAERHYKNNKYDIKNRYRTQHKSAIKKRISYSLNAKYGYRPTSFGNEFLWILGSKRHPEFEKHHEAYGKVKTIFAKMKHDQPIDGMLAELTPIIDYFNDAVTRYPGKKRKLRKVRYASYYNLANIYYYLDMPEKVKEYGQKIIDNDYDKSDGKRFIRYADALKATLEKNQMKTRHMVVVTEDISNVVEEEEEQAPVAQPKAELELNKAYLITQKNDTVLVDVNTKDIASIGYSLKTVQYDKNGTPVGSRVEKAKGCKELLFVDGLHFKNIKFKESSTKSGSLDLGGALAGVSDKLCKVLYESDKIGLYKFNNKELVIVPAGSEKGKSTSGMGFVFGFKKKLAKIAESCPAVAADTKKYKNTEEDLLQFCKDLSACK